MSNDLPLDRILQYRGTVIPVVLITDNHYARATCVAMQSLINSKAAEDIIHFYLLLGKATWSSL